VLARDTTLIDAAQAAYSTGLRRLLAQLAADDARRSTPCSGGAQAVPVQDGGVVARV